MTTGAAKLAWENSRAQNGSLLVVMALAFEVEAGGDCIMTVAELAGKARLSERAVQAATADLTGLGELTVTRRAEGHRNGYCLSLPRGAESAPLPASSPADSAPPQILHPADSAPLKPKAAGQTRGAESAPLEIPDVFDLGSVVSGEKSRSKRVSDAPRPDVERICQHLADRVEGNGSKRPVVNQRWRTAARLLLDADGRTEQQVIDCIDWCQKHHFWLRNIRSMEKLREQYDRLRLDAKAERDKSNGRKPTGRSTPDDDYAAALERIRSRKENANGHRGNGDNRPAGQVSLPPAAD